MPELIPRAGILPDQGHRHGGSQPQIMRSMETIIKERREKAGEDRDSVSGMSDPTLRGGSSVDIGKGRAQPH